MHSPTEIYFDLHLINNINQSTAAKCIKLTKICERM